MVINSLRLIKFTTVPRQSHGSAETGGRPSQITKGIATTPAMTTVAVIAPLGSSRERAAAFQPAWVMALRSAERKTRRVKCGYANQKM